MGNFLNNIFSLHRYLKRTVVIIIDINLCFLCTWLALTLRLEEIILLRDFNFYPALISIVFAIPIFWLFGLYNIIFRFSNLSIVSNILASCFVYEIFYFLIVSVYSIQGVPRSIGVIQPMLLFFGIIFSRFIILNILRNNYFFKKSLNKKNVLIYGAGNSGQQLAVLLNNNLEFNVVGFIDDNYQLNKRVLLGKVIYSAEDIKSLIEIKNVDLVFLALPKINRGKRNDIIEKLSEFKLTVKTLPTLSEIINGRIKVSDIKDFNVEDLLNRDEIKPNIELLNKNIHLKTVLVTGAGGSIGSELCRQIIKLKPKKIILLELNEFALYKIYEELNNMSKNIDVISLLADVKDQTKLEKIFKIFNVETVYHAAAYKHVSLVEANVCEGVKNNIFGTLAVAKAAINNKVLNLVLISSDKAVRPTNIMGASKRVSELCIQGIYNHTKDIKTNFSIVRFGNVLESSGSVIPKFKEQIKYGGPVTLTHKDVTRYFMTVTEAAQLVIQAGAMGKCSEVFVLDMGKSIKILDLIHKMIKLSGFSVKDDKNKSGDIEIKITGLRPGEKLYEELLIGNNPKKTDHERIKKALDPSIPFDELKIKLDNLYEFLTDNDVLQVKKILKELVKNYTPDLITVDYIYKTQKNL